MFVDSKIRLSRLSNGYQWYCTSYDTFSSWDNHTYSTYLETCQSFFLLWTHFADKGFLILNDKRSIPKTPVAADGLQLDQRKPKSAETHLLASYSSSW